MKNKLLRSKISTNPPQSVAIVRLVGKALPIFVNWWTSRPTKGPLLHLPDSTITAPIFGFFPIWVWSFRTEPRKLILSNVVLLLFKHLTASLDRHHDLKTRFRLYRQYVLPIVFYRIFEMGLTNQGRIAIIGMTNTHHRSMAYVPIHLIRILIDICIHSLGLDPP